MSDLRTPVVAVVPVRSPGSGKSRLAEVLSDDERAALSGAMLADVALALRAAPVDRVVVAAGGPGASAAASALGLDVVLDPPSSRDLNEALHAAQGRLGTVGSLLIVMADLPRLSPDDVIALLETDAQVVVAPTDDGGTGGLLRRPPAVIRTAYGEQSSAHHLRLGHRAGVTTTTADLPGFAYDVDTWDDLARLREGPVGRFTAAFLHRLGPRLEDAS